VRAGKSVGEIAGARLKKCVLELGGSDAYVILDDADVDAAAVTCATSRLLNTGQSCVAAKRFIVTRKNAKRFSEKLHELLSQKTFGDPMSAKFDLGPMARQDLRDQLHLQVEESVSMGAKLALGGIVPEQKGFYYPASLLTNVHPGSPAFDEELFGPVAAVIEAQDEKQAIALANRSRYGLGGAIFSRDIERAKSLAATEMDTGMIFINDFVKSDASVPFGGVKESGLGRELGKEGCFEFTNIKTIFAKNT
jgi:succinate-semialdehyde dehydrogenase/glutarate-semialdehyde dehydrogenase